MRFSEAVLYASQRGCKVHKGAEPAEGGDKGSGLLVVKQADSQRIAKAGKNADAQDSHIAAAADGKRQHGRDALLISARLGFCR